MVFALSAPSILFGQQASPSTENDAAAVELRVTGSVSTPLALSMADLKKMPRKTLKVLNPHEKKAEVYEGVPLQELLRRAGVPQGDGLRGAAMANLKLRLQKLNLSANCITRGSPAVVMEPNPALPSTAFGAPSGGVFVRLKTSVRKSKLILSVIIVLLMSARSAS